jgi:hypothetical protein
MYARRVVPILLIAGGVMMFMHHKRLELLGQSEEGGQPRPLGLNGPHSHRGEWGKRAHEQAAQQPPASPPLM